MISKRSKKLQIISIIYLVLISLLIFVFTLSVAKGAVEISPSQVLAILLKNYLSIESTTTFSDQQEAVMMAIRIPRVILGVLVGSTLAVSGVALQGLFRNPMADPSLLGTSSGASFFVAAAVVLQINKFGLYTLPIAAFMGSMLSIFIIYSLAQQDRKTNVTTMLLAGIALNSLFMAGTGLFTFLSTDEELRTITFWQLGSLSGATWTSISAIIPFILVCLIGIPLLANALNALLLGEANARHLGVPVERVKWMLVFLVALGVGAAVSVSGLISFVGLVVPHLVRLMIGPNHKQVLPMSILVGAILLSSADLVARTMVSPSELPIGIMTALIGAPFFLYLILSKRKGVRV